ncbi:hypothetical protein FKG94_27295 [Exilibacterium tricleocarpae]|uniref:Uncharacterized protein n=1 Tax=Exilibacterium tricleocarpae TaxID=2591008 RepID=A0A545SMW9_9GAMM|nr:hypothetical protein [Exilibacterium tricleocarpae]TQV66301.1 hypothetical protein FKG94_27295 [Exilibacterium tricleocarpae]
MRPRGTNFCVGADSIRINIDPDTHKYLLDASFGECKSGYDETEDGRFCIAQHLTLALTEGENGEKKAQLRLPSFTCGADDRRLPGATNCTPRPPRLSWSANALACAPGSLRAVGLPEQCMTFALAKAISTDSPILPVSMAPCPEGTKRYVSGGMCFPKNVMHFCTPDPALPSKVIAVVTDDGLDSCPITRNASVVPYPSTDGLGVNKLVQAVACNVYKGGPQGAGHVNLSCPEPVVIDDVVSP